jgi:hypothetical protein
MRLAPETGTSALGDTKPYRKDPFPLLKEIELRLSSSTAAHLGPGLLRIAAAQTTYPFSGWVPVYLRSRENLAFDLELARKGARLYKKLLPIVTGTGRHGMRVDFIDLNMCLLAARGLKRLMDHGHIRLRRGKLVPGLYAASCGSSRRIENALYAHT